MRLKATENGQLLYAVRERRHGRITTRYFEAEYQANDYRAQVSEKKVDLLKLIEDERELNRRLLQLEKLVIEITDQTMIVLGFVRRKARYVLVKHVRTPLSQREKNHILRVKANAIKFSFNQLITSRTLNLSNQFRPSQTYLLPETGESGAPVNPLPFRSLDWRDRGTKFPRDEKNEILQTPNSNLESPFRLQSSFQKSTESLTRFISLPATTENAIDSDHVHDLQFPTNRPERSAVYQPSQSGFWSPGDKGQEGLGKESTTVTSTIAHQNPIQNHLASDPSPILLANETFFDSQLSQWSPSDIPLVSFQRHPGRLCWSCEAAGGTGLQTPNFQLPNPEQTLTPDSQLPMTQEHKVRLADLVNVQLLPELQQEVRTILYADKDNYKEYGDVSIWTQQAILKFVKSDSVQYESTIEGIMQLREELLADGDSAAERLAVELIITNHLQLAKTGTRLENLEPSEATKAEANHWAHVHNQAQIRLMRSMNHLMRIRTSKINNALKLYKNRPGSYDRSDYLERTSEEIDIRHLEVANMRTKVFHGAYLKSEKEKIVLKAKQEAEKRRHLRKHQALINSNKGEDSQVASPTSNSHGVTVGGSLCSTREKTITRATSVATDN